MDWSKIKKVVELYDPAVVNRYLNTRRWVILSTAPGQLEDKSPCTLYSLGWYGPRDPEYPEEDTSEFPPGTTRLVE